MSTTLVVTDAIAGDLYDALQLPLETAGVLLASPVPHPTGFRLLAREINWVPPEHYAHRASNALTVKAEGYVHPLSRAETTATVPFWFHTHPGRGSDPRPSPHDDVVDSQISEVFRLRAGSEYYGALIAAPTLGGLSFTGFLEDGSKARVGLDWIFQVGDRLRLTNSFGADNKTLSPEFDRNVRAFGPVVQQTLGALEIGVVGCGGTGSAVAELLARLGARQMTLIDPDELSTSNVTRVHGSRPELVGRPKAVLLKEHVEAIAPDATVRAVQGTITMRSTATHLLACDVVFGCTDDNAGRLVLSRLSSYFLTPVIDCGVLLTSDNDGGLTGIHGRVTTLVPGQACLVCRNRIDLARAGAELLTPEERRRRVDEGYAPALGRVEPAVVTYTTAVASLAVSELLERLIGFGPDPRPSEVLLLGHDRQLSTNTLGPKEGHYCDPASGKVGLGVTEPLLEQTWPDSV